MGQAPSAIRANPSRSVTARVAACVADRLGFEPKTALRLYGISSAAPSTGLGHLSVGESLGEDQCVAARWSGVRLLGGHTHLAAQYAGAVRVEFTLRELLVVAAFIGIGAVLWVVLIGPAALVLAGPRS
jgi:hypothetical protein